VIVVYAVINFVIRDPAEVHRRRGRPLAHDDVSLTRVLGLRDRPARRVLAVPLTLLVKALLVDADPETAWMAVLLTSSEPETAQDM
jgi:AI-2 transport protein TqsA